MCLILIHWLKVGFRSQPCEGELGTLREQQCHSYNDVALKDNYFHWKPYIDPKEPCVLYCQTVETGFILKMQQRAWNGTSCHHHGVCVAGRCKVGACDQILAHKMRYLC